MLWRMLIIIRALGFLAPVAVALLLFVAVAVAAEVDPEQREVLALVVAVSVAAGVTTMALLAWSYVGFRLNRIAAALERTLETDEPIHLHEGGIPGERRLARAFNTASGAFLQVEARATHDRLTGIPNRETLLAMLGAEVDRAGRHYKPLSVAFIDIDRFKPINDTYGHAAGDAVLRQVARLIAEAVRISDTFGRYGGEEFMLILPETLPEDAVRLAEELRALVQQEPLRIGADQTVKATISIGVAGGRGSELQIDMLVDRADAAMYAAKSLGRNRTHLYRELDDEATRPARADLGRASRPGNGHRAVGQRHGDAGAGLRPGATAESPRPAVGHDRGAGDRHRLRDGPAARGDRAHPDRVAAARPRQDRHPGGDPRQAHHPVG